MILTNTIARVDTAAAASGADLEGKIVLIIETLDKTQLSRVLDSKLTVFHINAKKIGAHDETDTYFEIC